MCACGLSLQSCVAQLLVSVVGLCGAREQLDHTRAFKKARIAIPWLLLRLKLELYNSYRKCTRWRGDVCYRCSRIDSNLNWALACQGYIWAIRHAKAGSNGSNSPSFLHAHGKARLWICHATEYLQNSPLTASPVYSCCLEGLCKRIRAALSFDCLTAVMYGALIL